jgi:D-glycero-D-manno-heptose 1,7-bisphosphate phosphatase
MTENNGKRSSLINQPGRLRRRAAFLDRDGVLNALLYHQDVGIVDSPFTSAQFSVLPRVPEAIRLLNNLGLVVIIISNQPGIAKEHFDEAMLCKFDEKLRTSLSEHGAHVDATYYCLHHPDAIVKRLRKRCTGRKPGIGMLVQAARDFGISLPESYMVGDGLNDIEAGARAGCRTIFLGSWKAEYSNYINPPELHPNFVARDLWKAACIIADDLNVLPRRFPRPTVQARKKCLRSVRRIDV